MVAGTHNDIANASSAIMQFWWRWQRIKQCLHCVLLVEHTTGSDHGVQPLDEVSLGLISIDAVSNNRSCSRSHMFSIAPKETQASLLSPFILGSRCWDLEAMPYTSSLLWKPGNHMRSLQTRVRGFGLACRPSVRLFSWRLLRGAETSQKITNPHRSL